MPDERYDYLCETFKPASKVPAFLHVMDIAGLVKGASEGLVSSFFVSRERECVCVCACVCACVCLRVSMCVSMCEGEEGVGMK